MLRTRGNIGMYEAKVTITLKKGISDPEGANTLKALHLLGFSNVKTAHTQRTFDLLIDSTDQHQVEHDVEAMCQRLLTNPVIHHYTITVNKTQ